MTTFQAIVYAIIHGFAEFLPVGASAHHILVPHLLNWPQPTGPFMGALALGSLLSVLIYFIHDWASMISSFLQVIIYRKKPMTLDERMPFFIVIATLPTALAWYYLQDKLPEALFEPKWVAVCLVLFALPLGFSESFSRKTKGMFDWNGFDALLVGIGQALMLVPGIGRMSGALTGGLFRNYNREAIAKFAYFASAPILAATAFSGLREISFSDSAPMADLSWLNFSLALIVTTLTGLLAIGGFMKHIQRKGFGEYIAYRCLLAIAVGVVVWLRTQS